MLKKGKDITLSTVIITIIILLVLSIIVIYIATCQDDKIYPNSFKMNDFGNNEVTQNIEETSTEQVESGENIENQPEVTEN